MRTTNGLNVPTGWGREQAPDRRPCPVCHNATGVETNRAGFRVLARHTWLRAYRRSATPEQCPGSFRPVAR